jgi:hypothetical protein
VVTPRERRDHAVVKIALGLVWRSGQRSRMVRRIAGSLEWNTYRAEIDALRAALRTEYAAAVERSEIEPVDPAPDLDAALVVALHYFHAKEAAPLPLPAGVLESTGDLLRYFVAEGIAGRWSVGRSCAWCDASGRMDRARWFPGSTWRTG